MKRFTPRIQFACNFSFWLIFLIFLFLSKDPLKNTFYNLFTRLSVYLGITTSISAREILLQFWPGLLILLLTFILGRFFCNWVCPLGFTIDILDKIFSKKTLLKRSLSKQKFNTNIKYILLFVSIFLSIFTIQLAGILDPLSLATRIYVVVIYSYVDFIIKTFFNLLYYIPLINNISEPIYSFLKTHFLDFNNVAYSGNIIVFFILLTFCFFSLLSKRFWCKYLCPLGAIFTLAGRYALLKKAPKKNECSSCSKCLKTCDPNFNKNYILTRKEFIFSIFSSVILIPVFKLNANKKNQSTYLLRPPGSLPEEQFLAKCIRCDQCMKVCPTNALHPVVDLSNLENIFTPKLIPRIGYCDKECNLCAQICPTEAIQKYPIKEKMSSKYKIGTAYILKDICFPWSENKTCLVCEEMCPVPEKAIKMIPKKITSSNKNLTIKVPYIDTNLCIGCGICENKCPVNGESAIKVRINKINI